MKPYLLLYLDSAGNEHFGWFEYEDELTQFIETNDVASVSEAIEIFNARDIEIRS